MQYLTHCALQEYQQFPLAHFLEGDEVRRFVKKREKNERLLVLCRHRIMNEKSRYNVMLLVFCEIED